MATGTSTSLVERQVAGLNSSDIDAVTAGYADDAVLVVVSPHTLPGSELRLEGREKIIRHFGRVLKGGIADVKVSWLAQAEGALAWRDTGTFWGDTPFSEAHTATLNEAGEIAEHVIHSLYEKQ